VVVPGATLVTWIQPRALVAVGAVRVLPPPHLARGLPVHLCKADVDDPSIKPRAVVAPQRRLAVLVILKLHKGEASGDPLVVGAGDVDVQDPTEPAENLP